MSDKESCKTYPPPKRIQDEAHCSSMEQYKEMYDKSINNPVEFWSEIASKFYWKQAPSKEKFLEYNFDVTKGPISIKWMQDGITNMCYNCVDRHVNDGFGETVAFLWEGNDPEDHGQITYAELLKKVCKFANVLKSLGVKKGDKVAIYMPMIIEVSVAMLACVRIGAIHSIVFGGFSAKSLAGRILDAECSILITADGVWRGTKLLNLKKISDEAAEICEKEGHKLSNVVVVRHLNPADETVVTDNGGSGDGEAEENEKNLAKRPYKITVNNLFEENSNSSSCENILCKRPYRLPLQWHVGRDVWWHELMSTADDTCEPEWLSAEEPMFMLYTSGSTGKPKGVLHTTAGYMLYSATTTKYSFDYHPGEVYWCTADVGWITGHTYVTYGPLNNRATSIIFEGVPLYPDAGRFWAVVDKYKVSKFYTAPTAIRTLMKYGEDYVNKYSRESLKVLGTVGEPINPEAWLWYHKVVGNSNCAVVDTFWQTETGGHTVTPLPGATPTKPGSATFPFFGIKPTILSEEGKPVEGEGEGYLVFSQPWPGIMRTVYGDHQRFETTYFKKFPGYYCTGDGAKRDKDGYIWVTGRIDDMLNVSGHLLSTAEVESAILEHPDVAENAVVAHPHDIKGECLYCFITVKEGKSYTAELEKDLRLMVRKQIGPFATPEFMQEAPGLPKTRSGKIMRRVLRKIAVNDRELGDVTTMADETVVDVLFNLRAANA